ncbi:calcium-binding protein [Planktotalea sp.]|uniref:calcium-binding protein n=1 Tax=Planktotalea sp. TaxID=2029877 RepID=UPI003D6C62E2
MATITYGNGNQGIWLLEDLYSFALVSQSETELVLQYNETELGPHDPTVHPWQYKLTLVDAVALPPQDPEAPFGELDFVAGTLSSITAFDQSGAQIAQIGDLDLRLDLLSVYSNIQEGIAAQKYVYSGDHTITGASDSSNPMVGWDDDNIRTGTGDDSVSAGRGMDTITDAGGSDYYQGGKGVDILSYQNWIYEPQLATQGIVADINDGTVVGPDGFTDTIVGIEGFVGSFLDDILRGSIEDNAFIGLQGDDTINGRGGFDIVDYSHDIEQGGRFGIQANLKKGTVQDGFHNDDTLKNVEGIIGTRSDDVLRDNKQDNYLAGGEGWDVLKSAMGNDTLSGGAHDDMFVFIGNSFGHDVITDWDQFDFILVENISSFEDLTISQNGSSAMIDWNGNTIELLNTDSTTLDEFNDFVYA